LIERIFWTKIGFAWRVDKSETWHQQYEKLVEFKQKKGHCLVPSRYQEDVSLGMWVSKQRLLHSKNAIRLDRKGLLDEIGFVWRVDKSSPNGQRPNESGSVWKKQYEKVVEFKRINGHCLVPRRYQEDVSALGKWVSNQRQLHVSNTLRLDQKVLLDEIGFAWKLRAAGTYKRKTEDTGKSDKTWHQQQYEKLVEFKRKNGHCLVPNRYKEDVSLVMWVNTQRHLHVNNTLRLDRKVLLEKLGLVWRVNKSEFETTWKKQYETLVEFKQTNGNCLVPQSYEEDASLGIWVGAQRVIQTGKIMRLDHKALLDELGFVWNVMDHGWIFSMKGWSH
jgi:hypothetical protein